MADQDAIQGVAAAAAHTGHVVQGVAGAAAQIGHQLASHINDPHAHGGTQQPQQGQPGVHDFGHVPGQVLRATQLITHEFVVPDDEIVRHEPGAPESDTHEVRRPAPVAIDPLAEERREAARQVVEGLETPQPQQQPTQESPNTNRGPSMHVIIIAVAVVAVVALYVIYKIYA